MNSNGTVTQYDDDVGDVPATRLLGAWADDIVYTIALTAIRAADQGKERSLSSHLLNLD